MPAVGEPAVRHLAQLLGVVRRQRRRQFDDFQPGAFDPANRRTQPLEPLAGQIPRLHPDHRLLADLQCFQPGRRQPFGAGRGDLVEGDGPTTSPAVLDELLRHHRATRRFADRLAERNGDAAHDLVADERRAVIGEEPVLVTEQVEVGQRSRPPLLEQRLHRIAVARRATRNDHRRHDADECDQHHDERGEPNGGDKPLAMSCHRHDRARG